MSTIAFSQPKITNPRSAGSSFLRTKQTWSYEASCNNKGMLVSGSGKRVWEEDGFLVTGSPARERVSRRYQILRKENVGAKQWFEGIGRSILKEAAMLGPESHFWQSISVQTATQRQAHGLVWSTTSLSCSWHSPGVSEVSSGCSCWQSEDWQERNWRMRPASPCWGGTWMRMGCMLACPCCRLHKLLPATCSNQIYISQRTGCDPMCPQGIGDSHRAQCVAPALSFSWNKLLALRAFHIQTEDSPDMDHQDTAFPRSS